MSLDNYFFAPEEAQEKDNDYDELKNAFSIVVKKLLESNPELDTWIEKNFSKYLK